MFSPMCPFCGHSNPAAAKYCNDCGSPLHLKPCNQCEAVNDATAHNCYNCGAEFRLQRIATEPGLASAPLEMVTAAKASKDETSEGGHTPLPEWGETLNEFQRRLDNQTAAECKPTAGREAIQAGETTAASEAIGVVAGKHQEAARDREAAGSDHSEAEVVVRRRRSLARGVTPFFVAAQRATHMVPFHNL